MKGVTCTVSTAPAGGEGVKTSRLPRGKLRSWLSGPLPGEQKPHAGFVCGCLGPNHSSCVQKLVTLTALPVSVAKSARRI